MFPKIRDCDFQKFSIGPGCQRLDFESAITVPLTWFQKDADLLQIIIDLRKDEVLPKWDHVSIIYDIQASNSVLQILAEGFSSYSGFEDIPMSLHSVDSFNRWLSL